MTLRRPPPPAGPDPLAPSSAPVKPRIQRYLEVRRMVRRLRRRGWGQKWRQTSHI